MFVFSFNAGHYLQLKKCIYFFIVFVINTRKSCTPFKEILFPHDKFLHGWILPSSPPPLPRSPLPLPRLTPTPTRKSPLKMSVQFIVTITICKQWLKFVTCSPSPGDCVPFNFFVHLKRALELFN